MQFIECEDGDSWATVAREGIVGYTIRIEFVSAFGIAEFGPEGDRHVLDVERDGLKVCETDESGAPFHPNATWLVPWDMIDKLVVV